MTKEAQRDEEEKEWQCTVLYSAVVYEYSSGSPKSSAAAASSRTPTRSQMGPVTRPQTLDTA